MSKIEDGIPQNATKKGKECVSDLQNILSNNFIYLFLVCSVVILLETCGCSTYHFVCICPHRSSLGLCENIHIYGMYIRIRANTAPFHAKNNGISKDFGFR